MPLETGHENVVDAVAPCSFVPLEERAGAVGADAALYRLDAGQVCGPGRGSSAGASGQATGTSGRSP